MTRYTHTTLPDEIDAESPAPDGTTGTELGRDILPQFWLALLTLHALADTGGDERPQYITDAGNGPWYDALNGKLYFYDGTSDIEIGGVGTQRDGAITPHEDLVIKYVSATQVDVDADAVILFDSNGVAKRFASVNETLSITSSGANGLDTGSEANSTWYAIWGIGKADGTFDTLLSSWVTPPTLPAGYTYKGLLGAVRNDSSGNFVSFLQRDRLVTTGENFTASRVLANGTSATYANIDLSPIVPPNAISIDVEGEVSTTSGSTAATLNIVPSGSGTTTNFGQTRVVIPNQGTVATVLPVGAIALETAQQIAYRVSGTNAQASVRIKGYWY